MFVPQLTILSAYHARESQRLLELNRGMTAGFNRGSSFRWLVADNAPEEFRRTLDRTKFMTIRGASSDASIPRWVRGSYQYAAGLNKLIPYIATRFVVALDSDFFIVRPDWITEVLTHIQAHGLAFFGVPWHPRWHRKPRLFPAPHTLFIDLERIPRQKLDFLPQYDFAPPRLWQKIKRRAFKLLPPTLQQRLQVGTSLDVASKLYLLYVSRPGVKYESVIPVHDPGDRGAFESLLPRRWSPTPPEGSFSPTGFRELGFYDVRGAGWEEFLWKGRPYGFHLRGSHKLKENFEKGIAEVEQALRPFVGSAAA
jgi:hypothetical protein